MAADDPVQDLLDDIVARPEESSLWLVLADRLDEQGDPRAELVRLTWSLQYEPDNSNFNARQKRLQALLAEGVIPVRPRLTLAPGVEFAWVAPGSFLMGSPSTERQREGNETQHRVTLTRGLWMGVAPVTQGQWRAVMGDNPSYHARTGAGKDVVAEVGDTELESFPVESVSWQDAQDFCAALAGRVDREVRLPSEAEWEYACRAGTTTPFHFGKQLNGTQANCDGRRPYGTRTKGPYLGRPTPVGSYPTNAWGLSDLHGNVWEWCRDAYRADYENLPSVDPVADDTEASSRVLRGGSFVYEARYCRSAYRRPDDPTNRYHRVGFRVCFNLA